MGVAVLWTAFILAHQRCSPNPSACGVRQGDPMEPFFFFCLVIWPFLEEEASTQVQSLTYMNDIYLVGAPDKMPGVISSLQQKNLGSVNLNLNTNKSWTTRECMRGLKVNKEPKVMKAPVAIGESVKVLFNSKVANTVKAIEKEGH